VLRQDCEVAGEARFHIPCGTGWQEGKVLAGRASRTALGAAVHRAVHQLVDVPKIFDDPLAGRILGAEGGELLRSRLEHLETGKRLRMLIAARSRIAEDAVREAVRGGVRQYVLLGAGLDTFAYRNPYQVAGLLVLEVDHPETQAWKRARLAEAGIDPPPSVRFAAFDFECGALRAGLETAGFRFEQPAVFAWLGVVPYLDRLAFVRTLALVASGAASTEIVFDYAEPPHALGPAARAAYESAAQRVAEAANRGAPSSPPTSSPASCGGSALTKSRISTAPR
jgi:methyltransferase (TIGR00027 family)